MKRDTAVIAHRGASALAPENTIAAVRAAVEVGADGCEVDVRATRDGRLVLLHDETLDRTTAGRGPLGELTWPAARKLGVPDLRSALEVLGGSGCLAVIELKEPDLGAAAAREVAAAGMVEETVLISFHPEALAAARAAEPRIRLGLLAGEEVPEECGTEILDLPESLLTAEMVRRLHDRGLAVWTYTVNDPERFRTLEGFGVDAVATDRPHDIR